jgi:thiol-disulfide isomerase/thioredoxin
MRKGRYPFRLFLLIFFAIFCQAFIFPQPVSAQSPVTMHKVVIYLFWGDGCPHCAAAKPFLEGLTDRYSNLEIRSYEVWHVAENQEIFKEMAASFGFEPHGVPTIFIGGQYWEGYSEQIGQEIESAVKACSITGCKDAGVGIIPGIVAPVVPEIQPPIINQSANVVDFPLIGPIDLASQSLWVSTALISFVDGVNPCSVWVLTMLLAITLHTGSRKKVLLIGLIFITVTAGVYALFIAGLFSMLKVVAFMGWIQIIVALVAMFFGLVNIKDYFWYKEGISFTIADDKKPGIYQRMRKLIDASQTFWGLASATVVLSAGVSLVEFSCTAGFPVLWVNLLVSQKVTSLTFIFLLLLYLLIYQLDEMVIFFTSVYTLKASKLEEKHGRILKLIGGMLMFTLAGVMFINPTLMNSLGSSLIIFGAALLATLFVLFIHRFFLPKIGIYIGTELGNKPKIEN